MESLSRYPLSVILSFLTETEGTSLLLTKKSYTKKLLPIFELPGIRMLPRRHKFLPVPIQDSDVLLARLNTRRLHCRRIRPTSDLSTEELASLEWQHPPPTQWPTHLELLRFYNGSDDLVKSAEGTLIVSYPRSGNTLVRTLLERTTGIVTGSDTRPDRSLSRELAEQHNLVGEGLSHKMPWVKTHWPERKGNAVFTAKRAILVVRNPYDAIDSYWNMNATKSHTKSLTEDMYTRFRDKFDALARNEIDVWMRFHQYWMDEVSIPVLVVRFEDLVSRPSAELTRMLGFSLGEVAPLREVWEQRIEHVVSVSSERLGSYKPRSGSTGSLSFGKSLRKNRYSREVLGHFDRVAMSYPVNFVCRLGYALPTNSDESEVPFFTQPPSLSGTRLGSGPCSMKLNSGNPIRSDDCPFGRRLQLWRHSVTKNDAEPLPTTQK